MNVFLDVQGTLVSGGIARPQAREVFERLAGMGHDVYLWSSAGPGYAKEAASLLGVDDIILGCFSKTAPPPPVTVDFAVDDVPGVTGRYGGHTIPPFDGNPDDRELLKVVEAVASASAGASAGA